MNSREESDDALTASVRRGLYKLRQGDFFMVYGLDESAFKQLLPLPELDDKAAAFNIFLRAVSELDNSDDEEYGTSRSRKTIYKERLEELVSRRNDWIPLIEAFTTVYEAPEPAEDGGSGIREDVKVPSPKKRRSSRQVKVVGPDEQKPAIFAGVQVDSKSAAKKKRTMKRPLPEPEKDVETDDIMVDADVQTDQKLLENKPKRRRTSKQGKAMEKQPTNRGIPQPKSKVKPKKMKPAVSKELLERKRNEVKKEFEAKKADILEQIPEVYKQRFRQIGFSMWSKSVIYPILILSPFDVPPGPVRQQWMKMFENCKRQGRLKDMANLVYWYGATNLEACYSFQPTKNIISFEAGCKKKYDILSPKIQKLVDNGSTLKGRDLEIFNGLREMGEDLAKDPSERQRGVVDFPEEYDLINEQDIVELDEEESEREDNAIDDGDTMNEDEEDKKVDSDTKVDSETKGSPEVEERSSEGVVQPKVAVPELKQEPTTSKVASNVDDFGEAEISDDGIDEHSSADDDDDFKPPEVEKKESVPVNKKKRRQSATNKTIEETQGDSKPQTQTVVSHKKKKPKLQVPKEVEPKLKKQGPTESKSNLVKEPQRMGSKKTEKKTGPTKRSREEEQKLFAECQDQYLPIVRRWQSAIDEASIDDLTEILKELLQLVDKFSASFFEAYRLNEMMKPKTRELMKEKEPGASLYHDLWKKMKVAYTEKKATMPDDFVAVKRKSAVGSAEIKKEEKGEKMASKKPRDNVAGKHQEKQEAKPAETGNVPEISVSQSSAVPRKRSNEDEISKQSRLDSFACHSAPSSQVSQGTTEAKSPNRPPSQSAVLRPEKKKFSLGNLMRPTASTTGPADRRSSGEELKATQTSEKGNTKKLPDWMIRQPRCDPPTSMVRSFGHEFLVQGTGSLPEDVVNVDSMALELEDAIYQYATEKTNATMTTVDEEKTADQGDNLDDRNEPWTPLYWKMVYLLAAAISGRRDSSSLHPLLLQGKYATAMDIVKIPESNLRRAFENLPLLDHVRD